MSISAIANHSPTTSTPILKQNHAALLHDPILQKLKQENSCWKRFKACFRKISPLESSLNQMNSGAKPVENIEMLFDHLLNSPRYEHLRPKIRQLLLSLSPADHEKILKHLAATSKTESNILERGLSLITLEELKIAIPDLFKDLSIDEWISDLGLSAQITKQKEIVVDKKNQRNAFCNYIRAIIDTILTAFRFFGVNSQISSSWAASNLISVYGRLFAIPALVFTALVCIFTAPIALLLTAAIVLLTLLTIGIYLKYRAQPETFSPFHNLTSAARKGEMETIMARDDLVDQIIRSLVASDQNTRQHVILVGPTGVGKTETMTALAQRIVRGDVPNKLKGMELHGGNTADILGDGFSMDSMTRLTRFRENVEPYKNKNIFFFDEFQAAAKLTTAPEEFCKLLDTSRGSFSYCIASITQEDYDKYIVTNPALARRFIKIDVKPTNEEQTLRILRDIVRKLEDLQVCDELLREIINRTKGKIQPNSAKEMLNQTVSFFRLQQCNIPSLEEREAKARSESLNEHYRSCNDPVQKSGIMKEIKALQAFYLELERKRNENFAKWPELKMQMALKRKLENELYALALEIQKNTTPAMKEPLIKKAIAIHVFSLPAIEAKIKALQTACSVPIDLNITLFENSQKKPVPAMKTHLTR